MITWDNDNCTSILEAQKRHARGVNDCQSPHKRVKPNGGFFTYQTFPSPIEPSHRSIGECEAYTADGKVWFI